MSLRSSCCCLFLLLTCALPAHAAEYCVGTPTEIQNALLQAETDGEDSLVKVRAGTYALETGLRYQPLMEALVPAGRLTVRGGYNSGCTSYSLTPGATTFTSSNHSEVRMTTNTGHISVLGATFQGAHLTVSSRSAFEPCAPQRHTLALRRVRIDQAMLSVYTWCHDVSIENSLFTNAVTNPDSSDPNGTAIRVSLDNNISEFSAAATMTMVNSSIINGRLRITDWDLAVNGKALLYNNIFTYPGHDITSEGIVLAHNNRFDGIQFSDGGGLLPSSSLNTTAAPQLDASHVPVLGSPMINAGTSLVPDGLPATDHAGTARVNGARVDIGALESPVDGSGVFTVTNTNAAGPGSLAQALDNANSDSGFNRIAFAIPGGCPHFISLSGALQVRESVNFDGWSQPGSVKNTSETGFNAVPCVVLRGNGGIGIEAMGELGGEAMVVRGLAFEGFDLAIALAFGEGHAVYGNQFGGVVGSSVIGHALSGNAQAIELIGGGKSVIGTADPAYRNLIGGSSDVGVLITTFLGAGGDDNRVIGNLIGISKNGIDPLPNGTGIRINGGFNLIRNNRISYNTVDGILLSGQNAESNQIIDNLIGGAETFSLIGGNGRMGVMVQSDAHDNQIGPDNRIGRNGDDGVRIMSSAGGRNRITGNRIARNQALGIDLGANGVSANDNDPMICDPTLGCAANRGQNFPAISGAERRHSGVTPVGQPIRATGTLRSTPGIYRIEVFGSDSCEANGHGEGHRPLGTHTLTIDNAPYCPPGGGPCFACANGNCTAPFTIWLPELDVVVGDALTMTATSPAGDTSEFSACVSVTEEPGGIALFSDGFED